MDIDQKLRELDKEITKVHIMEMPGTIICGLGLYAKFAADGDAFHPLLNNSIVVDSMLGIGISVMIWGGYKVFTLSKAKAKLLDRA